MLFDTRPKERKEDLYDREREVNDIRESVERGIWVAVYGVKRIGKTSVVNVAVNDPKYIVVKLNMMRLYSPKAKRYSRAEFFRVFLEGLNEAIRRYTLGGRVVRFLSNVLGIDEGSAIELNSVRVRARLRRLRGEDVSTLIRELDQLASDQRRRLVLVIDEAQEMMKVSGINFPSVFHDVYDYCKSTAIAFTGSSVGLLERALKNLEYERPFFGRYIRKIKLERFSEEMSRDFLKRGFEEEEVKVEEKVIEEAVRRFDGIPGWLTFFGAEYSFRAKRGERANIDEIEEMAVNEVKAEFRDFLLSSQAPERYAWAVMALDRLGGKGTLNEVTKAVNAIYGEVPEPRVYELLNRLVDLGFIDKEGEEYRLPSDTPGRKGLVLASKEVVRP